MVVSVTTSHRNRTNPTFLTMIATIGSSGTVYNSHTTVTKVIPTTAAVSNNKSDTATTGSSTTINTTSTTSSASTSPTNAIQKRSVTAVDVDTAMKPYNTTPPVPSTTVAASAVTASSTVPMVHDPALVVRQPPPKARPGWCRWIFGWLNVRHSSTTFGNFTGIRTMNDNHPTTATTTGKALSRIHNNKKNLAASSSFLRLARERRFDDIVMVLTYSSSTFIASWLQVQQASRSSICECLHAICMYRPTVAAVKVVLDAIQVAHVTTSKTSSVSLMITTGILRPTTPTLDCVVNASLVTDAYGRTPLHIAVACGCSLAVVELLVQDNYEAVYMTDHTNRYPLHWACCCCCCSYKPPSSSTPSNKNYISKEQEVDNIVKIINRLMEIYAMAVILKDDTGCTPLDLAKSNQADPRIISALQFVEKILPVKKRPKSSPDELTVITGAMSKYPIREALCIYKDLENTGSDGDDDGHTFMDDVSSIGSRGVSKCRSRAQQRSCRRIRSESPKRSRIRELVHI